MERVKPSSLEKILICTSCMVLVWIKAIRTAAGLIDVPFVSMANASLTQPCRSSVHQLFRSLMTQHLLLHYPVPQPYAKGCRKIHCCPQSKDTYPKPKEFKTGRKARFGLDVGHIVRYTGLHWVPNCAR